ncbi:alpha-galactosidase [Ruminococcus sp.]|uniref:alpha-galactosidase n=1 Tax=Ruminococcus sp. TaxID=41978 RepID=UPI002E770364|nr:alpha-galactosidase [Ruminococcus sp.]MEE1397195.1 alpha-galactosidase [Ruminococcus sp.]
MPIFAEAQERLFRIRTAHTEYQMCADSYGVLKHLWYGVPVGHSMDYLRKYPDVGFAGNLYEAGNDRTYSLNTLPQEYAGAGVGDYRISAANVRHADGSQALDLRYQSYAIKPGKYSIPGLPAVYADAADAETLEITLRDAASGVEVVLQYGVLPELDIITRSAVFRNTGASLVVLQKAASLCLDLPDGTWEWMHFHGRHAMERMPERTALFHGVQESSSARGTSSHQQNPSAVLCAPDCTEQNGSCIGAFLMYSGSFQTQIELDQLDQVRLVMGLHPDLFAWTLQSGEEFHTPEAVFTYSDSGLAEMSQRFHKVIREHVCRGKYQLAERPVLINNWEATYFDFNEEKIWSIAKSAAELGVDMLVLDDGWFGKRDGDCSGLGDWDVNETKLRGGLGKLVEQVRSLGMQFGLWFEPEMISEDSDLYRSHPDWAIRIPDRAPMRSRYQLLLDMTRQEVQDYLYEKISGVLHSAAISYVKWDMNRSISDWYSATLPAAQQGELPHRYVLGLYALLERLTAEFPDVLFEGCSGGGGRFDAGMLYYCPQIWCSDDTDAYERTRIQYGTSMIYPISAVGSHVSVVPNHQTGRITPMETRGITAMAGSFGFELDLQKLSEEDKKTAAAQIKQFKEYGPLIHGGKYYRLSDPFTENSAFWSFVAQDDSEVLVQGVVFRTAPNMRRKALRLAGLCPESRYQDTASGEIYTGAALMHGGLLLPQTWGDYCPVMFHLKKIFA